MSRITIEEARTAEPLPPTSDPEGLERGQRQWDFVIARANKTLTIWRMVALLSVGAALLALWYAFDNISKPKMVPYVVTVDAASGRVDFRGVIQPQSLPVTDAVVRHHLLRFVRNMRTVSSDQAITRRFLQDAYYLATPEAGRQLTEMIATREGNPLQLSADGFRRDVEIQLFEKLSERLWRVEWIEQVRQNGELVGRVERTGTFSFVTALPATELEAEENPFGFYIDEFFLSERR